MALCCGCLLTPAETWLSEAGTSPADAEGAPLLQAGEQVGLYTVEEPLGEGGFGVVYRARQEWPLSREVALKVLKHGVGSPEILSRFRREQDALALMDHPGIATIFESGETRQGLPYFVMELIPGRPVTQFCLEEKLGVPQRLELFLQICAAVHHAHQKAVIHRDLKPSNLLAYQSPEGPRVKVIDFGIAKAVGEGWAWGAATVQGRLAGTPPYMSPEQLGIGARDVDTRADVYVLGVVLYEMLAGIPPLAPGEMDRADSIPELVRRVAAHRPTAPSRLAGAGLLPGGRPWGADLDQIVLKALQAERRERYATVAELAQDVEAYLAGLPVRAQPPTFLYLAGKFLRRHWLAALGLALVTGSLIGAVVVSRSEMQDAQRANRNAQELAGLAQQARLSEERARTAAERRAYQGAVQIARHHLKDGEGWLAAAALERTQPRLRGWEWHYLLSATPRPELRLSSGISRAELLSVSRDGQWAAAGGDSEVRVLELSREGRRFTLSPGGPVAGLALSADGSRLAVLSRPADGGAESLAVHGRAGALLWSKPVREDARLAWEPGADGALLVLEGSDQIPTEGRLRRLDGATGRALAERELPRQKVSALPLAVDPDGSWVAVPDSFSSLRRLELPSLRPTGSWESGNRLIHDLAFGGGRLLASMGEELVIFEPGGLAEEKRLLPLQELPDSAGSGAVRRINFDAAGRWLAVGDGAIRREGELPRPQPHSREVQSVGLGGGRRAALLADGIVEIRPEPVEVSRELPAHHLGQETEGRTLAFSADSTVLAYQDWTKDRIRLLRLEADGSPGPLLASHPVAFRPELEWSHLPVASPGGGFLHLGGGALSLSRLQGDVIQSDPLPLPAETWSLAFSSSGSTLAAAASDVVRVLRWPAAKLLAEWPVRAERLQLFPGTNEQTFHALSPQGQLSRLGPRPLTSAVTPPRAASRPPWSAFHPSSGLLAVAAGRGILFWRLHDVAAPVRVGSLELDSPATALAFDPGGRRLAAATENRQLGVWDWEEGLLLIEFPTRARCSSLAFSPDGRCLANADFSPNVTLRCAGSR